MKKVFAISLLCLLQIYLYTQEYVINFSLSDVYEDLFCSVGLFSEGFGVYTENNGQNEIQIFKYQEELRNGFPVLTLSDPIIYNESKEISSIMLLTGLQKTADGYFKEYTVMYGKSSNSTETAWDFFWADNSKLTERFQVYSDCSSYLTEKNTNYGVDNLRSIWPDSPWVEGSPGYGIGEGFTMESGKLPYLLLMNGYISMDKSYLYFENARVKQLKITGIDSGTTKITDVLDTPHPQTIDISEFTRDSKIRVEIADVYPGTKYEDTCIHYCVAWNNQVIPYLKY